MIRDTIIYVSNKATGSQSVLAALKSTGYDVVSTDCSAKAIALLFVMRSAVAVVIDQRMRKHTRFEMARKLRAIRPGVPIVLLSREHIDSLPSFVDASVSADQPLEDLTSILQNHAEGQAEHSIVSNS